MSEDILLCNLYFNFSQMFFLTKIKKVRVRLDLSYNVTVVSQKQVKILIVVRSVFGKMFLQICFTGAV
ncbi:MAG: hypothetical protein ACI9JY_000390 [Saprospiraceae bacterium]|jgi:hypothetical protein